MSKAVDALDFAIRIVRTGYLKPELDARAEALEVLTALRDSIAARNLETRRLLVDGATAAEPMAVDIECTLCQEPITAGTHFWLDPDDHPSHPECWEAEIRDAADMQRHIDGIR